MQQLNRVGVAGCLVGCVVSGAAMLTAGTAAASEMSGLPVVAPAALSLVPVTVASPSPAAALAAVQLALGADPEPVPAGSDFFSGWKRNADVGLNGSEGNSENFSGRAGVGAVRTAADMVTKAGVNYSYATANSDKTKSRGEAFLRNDWVFTDTPWGLWAQGKIEHDEFQEWDWRLSFVVGPTYQIIKNDRTSLKARAGLGGSYVTGGSVESEFRPEAMLGLDLEHKLTERQKLTAFVEYYPSLDEFPDYRLVAGATWEVLVDPEANMFLKAGVLDRYDSQTKSPAKNNDFEYFLTLSWVF